MEKNNFGLVGANWPHLAPVMAAGFGAAPRMKGTTFALAAPSPAAAGRWLTAAAAAGEPEGQEKAPGDKQQHNNCSQIHGVHTFIR